MTVRALGAVVGMALAAGTLAQTVEFRLVERTGQTIVNTVDPVLEIAVQARVTGGASLGGFAFDIVMPGEMDSLGTLQRALISNTDGTYVTLGPWVGNNTVGRGGVAATFSYLAGIGANFNGLVNTSGGTFTQSLNQQEIGLIAGAATDGSLLHTPGIDGNGDGNPDTWPGSGTPPVNAAAALDPASAGPYFGAGQFVDVYRFRYTLTNLGGRTIVMTLANVTAQTFTQLEYTNGRWGAQSTTTPAANISVANFTMFIPGGPGGESGRCCNPSGLCSFVAQADCPVGSVWSFGLSCTASACAGRCCNANGACTFVSIDACASGTSWTLGGACSPNPCPGACCNGTACAFTSEAACLMGSGSTFRGAGVVCGEPGNPTGCCRANWNGQSRLTVQDIFDYLNAWFAGAPGTDFNMDGSLAAFDIFAFLNAWFMGCQG